MDLNLVRTFLVVAENLSYTKAAHQLNITQPAVSSAIKRLEREYGQTLFVKNGRGIELTTKGYQLIPFFRQGLDIIENAMYIREHFNIYCNESILHTLLPMENIKFTESPQDKSSLFDHLRHQKADLIIDTILTKDNSFVIEEVCREPVTVVCRRGHPRIQGELTKEMFYSETHILNSATWENMTGFEQITQEPIEDRKTHVVSSSIAGLALHAAQSDALAFIPKSFALKWSDKLDLQILDCPVKTNLAPYHMMYHKREIQNPAHKALRDNIKDKLSTLKYLV